MKDTYKISIPEPCHEEWNKMTPDSNGRFCQSCSKTVIDFSKMKAQQIQQYFIQNQGKNICGHFKTEQLNSITIQIPQNLLYTPMHFHKMFLLALLIAMGTTLLSCKDEKGNSKKINKVEIISEHRDTLGATVGEAMPLDTALVDGKVCVKSSKKDIPKKIKENPIIDSVKYIKEDHTTGVPALETVPTQKQ
jgi:hypothetical protein